MSVLSTFEITSSMKHSNVDPSATARSTWKHFSFTVMCHLMYPTVLSFCAFILQDIIVRDGTFVKSNSTGWVIPMTLFSLERTWETGLWAIYGKKRCTFIISIKDTGTYMKWNNILIHKIMVSFFKKKIDSCREMYQTTIIDNFLQHSWTSSI